MRASTRLGLGLTLAAFVLSRIIEMALALREGNEAPLLAFPLAVLFPSAIALGLLCMGPTTTSGGILMRLGTIIQLLLIVAVPRFALHLALGLPVVFLCVEMFETRLPARLREPLRRIFVQ